MFDKKKYSAKFYVLSGVGAGVILSFAIIFTIILWQNGIEGDIYSQNYSTSVFFTDGLTAGSGAAPWALISVNWLGARTGIKRWRSYLKNKLS